MSTPALDPLEVEEVRPVTSLWWIFVLVGIATLGVGLFFVFSPHETLKTFSIIAGIFLVVDAVLALLASIFGKGEGRGLLAVLAIASLIAGVILIRHPFTLPVVFILIVGLWFLIAGVIRLVSAFGDKENRGQNFLIAGIDIVAGVVILAWPDLSLATVAVIIGIFLIIRGLLVVVAGLGLRSINKALPAA